MRRSLIIGTCMAALLTSGCGVVPALPPGPSPLPSSFVPDANPTPLPLPGALSPYGFDAALGMTVRVRNVGCGSLSTGSGFAIDANTLITNRHVIADANELELSTYDGRSITATNSASTTLADIAVIHTEEDLGVAYAVLAQEDPVPGDVITVVGYPGGGALTTVAGVVIGEVADPLGGAVGTVLATTAVVEPGSSGSPVLNEAGEIVGVIYAKNGADQSFMVPVSTLQTLLNQPTLLEPLNTACSV